MNLRIGDLVTTRTGRVTWRVCRNPAGQMVVVEPAQDGVGHAQLTINRERLHRVEMGTSLPPEDLKDWPGTHPTGDV